MNSKNESAELTPHTGPEQQGQPASSEFGVPPPLSIVMKKIHTSLCRLDQVDITPSSPNPEVEGIPTKANHRKLRPKERQNIIRKISQILRHHHDNLSQTQRIVLAICASEKASEPNMPGHAPWTIARVSKSDYFLVKRQIDQRLSTLEGTAPKSISLWRAITDPTVCPNVYSMFCEVSSASAFLKKASSDQLTGVAPSTQRAITLLRTSLELLLKDPAVDRSTVENISKVIQRYFANDPPPEDVCYRICGLTDLLQIVIKDIPQYTINRRTISNA